MTFWLTGTEDGVMCNLSSPSFLEWDAMTLFIESVMSRIAMTDYSPDPNMGVALLKSALAYQSQVIILLLLPPPFNKKNPETKILFRVNRNLKVERILILVLFLDQKFIHIQDRFFFFKFPFIKM